jgi:hypothetical protein
MEDLSSAVISLLRQEGISQRELADRVGVSQATVSRAARGHPLRPGAARGRLLVYLREHRGLSAAEPIFAAVGEIWDGSDAHAVALAQLLLASRGLWPNRNRE